MKIQKYEHCFFFFLLHFFPSYICPSNITIVAWMPNWDCGPYYKLESQLGIPNAVM